MANYKLTGIWIYPIKSLGGFSVEEAIPELRGLRYDRRWMLVDTEGQFVSQREIPEMALLGTSIDASYLRVFWKHKPEEHLLIPLEASQEKTAEMQVRVWDDQCSAILQADSINQWFSAQLKQELRLVYMPDTTHRQADVKYAPEGHAVSFADGFPYLMIGQSSLDDLNARMDTPLPMNRFRPNFVFTGGQPFEEDTWSDFLIGETPFRGVKPCGRCAITTTDQENAQRAAEPLKTLASFRKSGNRILFGQNVIWMGNSESRIRVGDLLVPQSR